MQLSCPTRPTGFSGLGASDPGTMRQPPAALRQGDIGRCHGDSAPKKKAPGDDSPGAWIRIDPFYMNGSARFFHLSRLRSLGLRGVPGWMMRAVHRSAAVTSSW